MRSPYIRWKALILQIHHLDHILDRRAGEGKGSGGRRLRQSVRCSGHDGNTTLNTHETDKPLAAADKEEYVTPNLRSAMLMVSPCAFEENLMT